MSSPPVTLITGTSRGIGKFLADRYTAEGHVVVGCSRAEFDGSSAGFEHHVADVTDERQVRKLFSRIRKTHGKLDCLINNAGIASMNHSMLTPISTVMDLLRVNVGGTFLFCREAAKLMQKRRYGRIVNLASVATPLRLEGEAAYASSKAAIVSLTQVLAREFAEFGITVNAVGPTPIKTDLIRSVPAEALERLVARQAIKRMGRLDDVGNVVDFFLQRDSSFVTGQTIYLGGV